MEVTSEEVKELKAKLLVLEGLLTGLLLNSLRAEPGALGQYRKDAERMLTLAMSQEDHAMRQAMTTSFDDIVLMLETALHAASAKPGRRPPPQ